MPKIRSCPVCADGKVVYLVIVRGSAELQSRKCPLPHRSPEPAAKRTRIKKATAEPMPAGMLSDLVS